MMGGPCRSGHSNGLGRLADRNELSCVIWWRCRFVIHGVEGKATAFNPGDTTHRNPIGKLLETQGFFAHLRDPSATMNFSKLVN